MIEIEDIKNIFGSKETKVSKETKDKIQSMIEDEKIIEKKALSKEKNKKKNSQTEKSVFFRYLAISLLLFLSALALFYFSFVSKTEAELQYQQQIKMQANKDISKLIQKATAGIQNQKQAIVSIIDNTKQLQFDSSSQLESLIEKLKSSLDDSISIQIIPPGYKDGDIIEHPDMGYTYLFLLNELKRIKNTANLTKIEVYKPNTKDKKLLLIQKVMNKDVVIAYVVASLSTDFINKLFTGFNFNKGYFEIIQQHSSFSSVLIKKGDASLKASPKFVSKKLKNTPWKFKYWNAELKKTIPMVQYRLVFFYLSPAILAFIAAIILFIIAIKNYRILYPVKLNPTPQSQKNDGVLSKLKTDKVDKKDNKVVPDKEAEKMLRIADNIFRAYDIRGVVGDFINTDICRKIARVIVKELINKKQNRIAVACDGRTSSPQLMKAVTDSVLEGGIDVIDIGMASSPMLYFSALNKADGNGLMITASHNPANYNGMKIMLAGHTYGGNDLQLLKRQFLLDENNADVINDKSAGKKTQLDITEEYIETIAQNINLSRPMKIVVDTGNGVMGKFTAALFKRLTCDVTVLNEKVDGNFPVHAPDPSRPENLADLTKKVLELKADIGFAFDGDGDRIGLIASDGQIIWPDRILMLLAKEILSRNEDATVLYDVKSTKKLVDFIKNLGGKTIMCQTGHSFMKNKMKQTGALIAGEMSGHIFINDRWFGFDDASYVAARVLEILSIDLRRSGHIFAELPNSINTPEILVECKDAAAIMNKIGLDTHCFEDGEISTIDGIRVEYPDGWGLVRASNTSDNLTLRFEADNEEALQRIANTFKDSITSVAPELELPF